MKARTPRTQLFQLCVCSLLLTWRCSTEVRAARSLHQQGDCRSRLLELLWDGSEEEVQWIDPDTPEDQCEKRVCTVRPLAQCLDPGPPLTDMVLVYSDEFNAADRKFGSGEDSRWHAMDMYYAATQDKEVYKPEAISTQDGALTLTFSREEATAPTKAADGTVYDVTQPHKSGMVQSWNQFCFTGGYLEASVKLPGDDFYSGLWPAMWLMGNLGRAGNLNTTGGMWPYSYDECQGSGRQPWDENPGQLINACPDPPGLDRTAVGLRPGQGRGAPEVDILEAKANSGNRGTPENPSRYRPPTTSHSLQMAPVMPAGLHWLDPQFYASQGLEDGVQYPGRDQSPYRTNITQWSGTFTDLEQGGLPRPGNTRQDSFSATSRLNASFFETFHKWAVDWQPGEYLRWYIDGVMVYEVNKNALVARQSPYTEWAVQRLIPMEPMYIIFNVAMSDSFSGTNPNLPLPAEMQVDYVRLYQRPEDINIGCSPPDYPTSQYIACHKEWYLISDSDAALIPELCNSTAATSPF